MMKNYFTWFLLSGLTLTSVLTLAIPVKGDGILVSEKRKVADFPKLPDNFKRKPMRSFSDGLEMYFSDRVPGREQLLELGALFPSQDNNENYVVGREHWLFLGNSYDECLSQLQGVIVDSRGKLEAKTALYTNIRDMLAGKGMEFHMMVGPDKPTIYPEYLPRTIKPAHSRYAAPTLSCLRNAGVDIYDPADSLIAHKPQGLLYWRTDTHWNQLGALLATEGFLRHCGLPVPPRYEWCNTGVYKGDLVNIKGQDNFPLSEGDNYEILWRDDASYAKSGVKVLVVGDSFSETPMIYLGKVFETIQRVHYNDIKNAAGGKPFVQALEQYIDSMPYKPDVVLWIQVERSFIHVL